MGSDLNDAIETFRTLAEKNREKDWEDDEQRAHGFGAANAYRDAANHLEEEYLDD